jgi:hypothetical protein
MQHLLYIHHASSQRCSSLPPTRPSQNLHRRRDGRLCRWQRGRGERGRTIEHGRHTKGRGHQRAGNSAQTVMLPEVNEARMNRWVMSQYPVSMSVPSSTTVPCSSMVTLHDAGCVVLLSALPCRAVHHQLLQIPQSAGISDKSTQPPVTPPRQHIQHATSRSTRACSNYQRWTCVWWHSTIMRHAAAWCVLAQHSDSAVALHGAGNR